jgi:hypothetical protein
VPAAGPAQAAPPVVAGGGGHGARTRLLVPAAVGAVALLAVIVLLVRGLSGAGGGASSPTAAVRQLARATEVEDPAAAIALIDPGEARTLSALYTEASKDLHGAGAVSSGTVLAGTHVAFSGLRLSEERLGTDVAKVRIAGGTLAGTLRAIGLPAALGALQDSRSTTDLADAPGPDGAGLFLMARKEDGRWYVSPMLTVLQYIVEIHHLAAPDFAALEGSAQTGQETSSPGRLEEALAQAISDSDVAGILNLISNREASAVRPYSAALQELLSRADASVRLSVSAPQFDETQLNGNLVRLDLLHTDFGLTISDDEGSGEVSGSINGTCVNDSVDFDGVLSGSDGSGGCVSHMHKLFGVDDFFVVAERTGAGLRLAPIATMLEYIRRLFDQLGSTGVRRLLGTAANEAPAGELAPGVQLGGRLNTAGYVVLSYHARTPGLLAIDSNREIAMLAPGGRAVQPLACPDNSQLYSLPSAGTYRVAIAAHSYEAGGYRVVAEPVQASQASVPGGVSGSVGDAGRIAVLSFQMPPNGVTFESESPVYSTIVGPVGGGEDVCYAPGAAQVLGPASLLEPPASDEESFSPVEGDGSTSEEAFQGAGRYYLVVSGPSGTKFSGTLSAQYSLAE